MPSEPLPRIPGTGYIEQQPNGTYRPRLPRNGQRLRACSTYAEAERLLDAAIFEGTHGGAHRATDLTLEAWGKEALDLREAHGRADRDTDDSRWKLHVASADFFRWPLSSLTAADLREWLDGLMTKRPARGNEHRKRRNQRLARQTVTNTLNLLRSVLALAVERGHLDVNPAADVRLPRGRGTATEPWTYLLPDEQRTLLAALEGEPERRRLVAFAMGTGVRQGEQWNLELRDATDTLATIRFGSAGGATKGRRIRRVPLFGLAAAAAREQRAWLAGRKNVHGLLWPSPLGERRCEGPPGWWEGFAADVLPPKKRHDRRHVRWHDLRHTCASSLIAGWWGRRWSLEEVKALLGHRSITTTERYAHLAPSVLERAAEGTGGL